MTLERTQGIGLPAPKLINGITAMEVELPVRYYRAVPSARPKGLQESIWTLDAAHTALIELHCWNFGFPGAPPLPEEFWVFMGSPQNHDKMFGVVTQVIAPLLEGSPVIPVRERTLAAAKAAVSAERCDSALAR